MAHICTCANTLIALYYYYVCHKRVQMNDGREGGLWRGRGEGSQYRVIDSALR